ncbi:protein TASOR isoform X2 [Danio aesculapii]|uniref:protein TASOR isoform X2 n=1 Tax=Danio aesculapii TaxID=1142201 RepID=UPI0024BF8C94|nr:protein TASOR isoform X2 [Danio aesculapii]
MACNFSQERKNDKESSKAGSLTLEDGDSKKQLLSASSTATSKQNGDQAGCEDEQMSEQDASERRRTGLSDTKNCGGSPSTLPRSAEELPRKNFQIPRKIKERKGLFQHLPPESREFEEVVKLLSTFYLDATSRATFTYTKASLIHNELLEKEFIEKKRELKQNGRTEAELVESYAFLLPDRNKVHFICEKGLSVGHSRINNLGNSAKGVYLSKYSDLLQMNPFEVGAAGEIILFKVMKGKVKIIENMPKNTLEPTLKYDSHVYKNASKVTSLLSYRAFEHTQQYFYEFAYDELKSRPRHVLPYAVVSFQYKGKESGIGTHRVNSVLHETQRVRRRYTVWSGSLVNKGEEVYQVYIRSSSLPHLPLKLPDKLDINTAMHLDQVKRKIPPVLLSWEAYSGAREVLKCGMHCSLYEVMGKSKQENSLTGLLQRLERERMVLVKPLVDKGFLFLLSSSQLFTSIERRGRSDRVLQALFIFQEQRSISKLISKNSGVEEDPLVSLEPKDAVIHQLDNFVPALHHCFYKLRANPPKELAAGVKRQALDYLSQKEQGAIRPFHIAEYRHTLDDRTSQHLAPRPKNIDVVLKSYVYSPGQFQLPVEVLQKGLMDSQQAEASPPAGAEEYSPVSDWGGSDRQPSASSTTGVSQSNGSAQKQQSEYDKEKMEKLLKLIQIHKRTLGKDEGSGAEREEDWDPAGLKRRLEREGPGGVSKYLKTGLLNGEPGRVVMDSMGLCDTDLRERASQSPTLRDTQALLKLFLSTLNRMAQSSTTASNQPEMLPKNVEGHEPTESLTHCDLDLRGRRVDEEQVTQDFLEEQMACSRSSVDVYSPTSNLEQQQPPRPAEAAHQIHQPWKTSTTDVVVEPCLSGSEKPVQCLGKVVDTILDREFQNLCTGIQNLMEAQHIIYNSQPPLPRNEDLTIRSSPAFSPFVSKYVTPLPVQGYVKTLCEKMNHLIHSSSACLEPVAIATPPAVVPVPAPLPPAPPPFAIPAPAQPTQPSSPAHPRTKTLSPVPKSQASSSKPQATVKPPSSGKHRLGTVKEVHLFQTEKSADLKDTDIMETSVSELSAESTLAGTSSTVIGQIKPDVLCTLMEIMQKNAVKFYIQTGDEESELCTEIKAYLRSLGNIACNPLNYLESKSQQKFMIIIQNEDIATHVHKIPALVSLKKLPTVYFAGVDSLDDVKNRTYNELFVSGGLIVSDELILKPDNIMLAKLQAFLKFLEEQGSPWKWKVHCKTQKKLKELSRLNTEALDLLNLLTSYQKKHLVEFLPYHECDTPSRQAPDLDCLVKLQAQHTQLRHLVFLTERHDDTFSQFSSSGVIIAGMNDIVNNFQSLISIPVDATVAALPNPVEPDAVRDEEDMSIDSEDDMPISATNIQTEKDLTEPHAPQPPPPQTDGFRPPLPDQPSLDPVIDPLVLPNPSMCPTQGSFSDYAALKSVIALYKAASQESASRPEGEDTLTSFGVNPHQSYLCPGSSQWSPYSGSPAYHMPSAYSSPVQVASRGSDYSQGVAPPGVPPPANPPTLPIGQSLPIPPSFSQPPVSLVEVLPPVPESTSSLQPPRLIADSVGVPRVEMASTANKQGHLGSQTIKTDVETPSSSTTFSSSTIRTTFPSYPEATLFPALTPIPPVPPLYNWGPTPGGQHSFTVGQSGAGFSALPSTQSEAAKPTDGSWIGATESGTSQEQEEEKAMTSSTSKLGQQEGGGEKEGALASSISCGQGSRTPVNSSSESQGGSQAPPARGGIASRGLLPLPGAAMGAMCRGGHNNSMYNPRGGPPDMMRGGFRGRGVPPHPMRSRPGRGHIRGGPSCNWGYPPGRGGGGRSDYYSDYTYN